MPKFYVTTGQIREMIVAQDAEGAALDALDRFFEPLSWVFGCDQLSKSDRRAHFAVEALTRLEAQVRVSETGFPEDRISNPAAAANDPYLSDLFDTADLLDTHFRLATAMNRFVKAFSECETQDVWPGNVSFEMAAHDRDGDFEFEDLQFNYLNFIANNRPSPSNCDRANPGRAGAAELFEMTL